MALLQEGLHIDSFKLPVACSCHLAPLHPFTLPRPHPPPFHPPLPHPPPATATIVAFGKK